MSDHDPAIMGKDALRAEVIRLRAQIGHAHDHLHHGRVNDAHEALHCTEHHVDVVGNLAVDHAAVLTRFAERFNALCAEMGVPAAFVAFVPSATQKGYTSIQTGGAVPVVKYLDHAFNSRATLAVGDHRDG